MEKTMNRARLLHLIDVLETVERGNLPFEMEKWAIVKQDKTVCGTAACAAGYAALDPEFRAEGFTLRNHSNVEFKSFYDLVRYIPNLELEYPFISFDGVSGWLALGEFFGLTFPQANYVFGAKSYRRSDVAPKHVIEHIHHVLEGTANLPPPRG